MDSPLKMTPSAQLECFMWMESASKVRYLSLVVELLIYSCRNVSAKSIVFLVSILWYVASDHRSVMYWRAFVQLDGHCMI